MFIESVELYNYRNYDRLVIDFENGITIICGDNAQGKTNLLEAIYVCSTSKSHRGSKDREIIKFNYEEAHIKLFVNKRNITDRLDMHIKKNSPKGIAINGIPIKKASELFGTVNVVFFSPEDLHIIKSSPIERRKFLDLELCRLDKLYVHNLISYNKIIMQRNTLLKEICFKEDESLKSTLDIWDLQLSQYGKKIIEIRTDFIHKINEIIYGIHLHLTGDKEHIKVVYESNVSGDNLYDRLVMNREKDIRQRNTSVGPHRDDIGFYVNEINVKKFGSQGQQRTVALSLKLSEIELIKRTVLDAPILLLDDVLSELDSSRQNHLLAYLEDIQTIITCTGLDEFIKNKMHVSKIYRVTESRLSKL